MLVKKAAFLIFVLLLSFPLRFSFAQEPGLRKISDGKYFTLYVHKGIDVDELLYKLDFTYLGDVSLGYPGSLKDSADRLSRSLDSLYSEVSDILDIHMYNYHGNIEIVSDSHSLSTVFKKYVGASFHERSVYLHHKNTIYISGNDITLGMLGHEIAHAIISNYFVVPPPAKVQEVLCGYVEYNLLKKTKKNKINF